MIPRSRAYHRIKLHFRIIGLTAAQVRRFKQNVLSVQNYKLGNYHENSALFVMTFKIKKSESYNDLCGFLKTARLPDTSYGLWVSILTTRMSGGVRVPDHIVRLYKRTGGLIDFNFDSR